MSRHRLRFRGRSPGLLTGIVLIAACSGENGARQADGSAVAAGPVPAELRQGEALYDANCAQCHGPHGTGTGGGPPLVDRIYEPSHHGDIAFLMAAQRGVRAHHWNFGNMPPVTGVSTEQVTAITAYVRWLQRAAGIH
jgi:mono/diheme cytochrome c family protein